MSNTNTNATKKERYFYHNFPRRGKGSGVAEVEKGLKILELIRDFGFVLAPEVIEWEYPHADGRSPRKMAIVQRRVCFTELSPSELPEHAAEFGHFALEFEIDVLKSLHAVPVFYIPRDHSTLGQTLVMQLIDAMCLIDRVARTQTFIDMNVGRRQRSDFTFGFSDRTKTLNIDLVEMSRTIEGLTFGVTPPDMLALALEGAMNFFYLADAAKNIENNTLKYYRQREWRVAGNVGSGGKELMGLPPPSMIDRLLALDSAFYGRRFPKDDVVLTNPTARGHEPSGRLVDWILVYQGIDERHIVGAARRIIVPRDAVTDAKAVLAKHQCEIPVIAIDELNSA